MNQIQFSTGGDWDSTTLYNMGQEVLADQLFIQLEAGRDIYGNPTSGGIGNGGQMSAYIVEQSSPQQQAIFPGVISLQFPNHQVEIQNTSPMFAIELTRIVLDGQDVTDNVLDLRINIDATNNQVEAYMTLYKAHWFSSDEIATYQLL